MLYYNETQKKKIMDTINSIQNQNKHKYYNPNPEAPNLHASITIHKTPINIRPIINCKHAPVYKLAIQLPLLVKKHIQLPITYNINNKVHLTTEQRHTEITANTKLCLLF
jgi:hypothetical protein